MVEAPLVPGYHNFVVGWRYDDRRRYRPDELGQPAQLAGKCQGCFSPTYLLASGVQAMIDRDANLVCDHCYQVDKTSIQEAL